METGPVHGTWEDAAAECDELERVNSTASFYPDAASDGTPAPAGNRAPGRRGSTEPSKQLACASCRKKKIRCQPSPGGGPQCQGCVRSGTDCIVPFVDERRLSSSKKLVRELYDKIASLESELEDFRTARASAGGGHMTDPAPRSPGHARLRIPRALLIRSCGGSSHALCQQHSQTAPRIPGAAEDALSAVRSWGPVSTPEGITWQFILPKPVEDALMELYWQYQNDVVPVIYKAAFLQDYRSGRERHCSRLLLHCMLARAAIIDAGSRGSVPALLRICDVLLKEELRAPAITTMQSLEVLAGAHRGSADDREHLYLAVRLGTGFGMASSMSGTSATETISSEREIKQICFLSCYLLDRLWTLYTGKPHLVERSHSAGIPAGMSAPLAPGASLERRMLMVWAGLAEITELLVEAICGARTYHHKVANLDHLVRAWYENLQPEYRYVPARSPRPAILHLYMQYSTTVILLHRPFARFGDEMDTADDALRETACRVCVQHACLISQYLQQFDASHRGLHKLSWISLHPICTAAATLVAALADGCRGADSATTWPSLLTCIRALEALGATHPPAEHHRSILLQITRLLELETQADAPALEMPAGSLWDGEVRTIVHPALRPVEDFLPSGGQGSLADMWASFAALLP